MQKGTKCNAKHGLLQRATQSPEYQLVTFKTINGIRTERHRGTGKCQPAAQYTGFCSIYFENTPTCAIFATANGLTEGENGKGPRVGLDEQRHYAAAQPRIRHIPRTAALARRLRHGGRADHLHRHCRKPAKQRLHASANQHETAHGKGL